MINFKLQIILILGTIFFIGLIILLLRKEKIELKYVLLWFFLGMILIVLSCVPPVTIIFARFIGVGLPVNAIFLVIIFLILLILLSLTVVISRLNRNNIRIAQEISLLRLEIIELRNKIN